MPPKRENFAQTPFGDHVWELVESGLTCGARDPETHKLCGLPIQGTLEFDVLGDAEILGWCSEDHRDAMKKRVDQDLRLMGRSTVFGENGFGRGLSNDLFAGNEAKTEEFLDIGDS